ncbi:MAG: hypothetical protein JO344_14135 [Planctomycetaceae bacterium]|nr:hypothetical protein [Planctomycetaceae bacterium]
MIEEKKTTGDAATQGGQGGEKRAESSNSVNTELRNAPPATPPPAKKRRRKRSARQRSRLPKKVLCVTTYERLGEYLAAFAEGHFHLLILVGSGGLAKSRSVRAVLGGKGCWIEGNATPFGMYVKLYRHRDEFVVIDDVDAIYADRSGVRLLKCLCQTEEEKAVAWHSDARSLERQRIPREFTTKSRVVIISNDWQTLNKNVAALQDRGHVLHFEPGALEVHREAGRWFDDVEIYEWFAKNLERVREPSLRHYVRARELKAAGMDWTAVLAAEDENKRARLAAELLESTEYDSTGARVQAFVQRGGGCRATFFNYRRYLLK